MLGQDLCVQRESCNHAGQDDDYSNSIVKHSSRAHSCGKLLARRAGCIGSILSARRRPGEVRTSKKKVSRAEMGTRDCLAGKERLAKRHPEGSSGSQADKCGNRHLEITNVCVRTGRTRNCAGRSCRRARVIPWWNGWNHRTERLSRQPASPNSGEFEARIMGARPEEMDGGTLCPPRD